MIPKHEELVEEFNDAEVAVLDSARELLAREKDPVKRGRMGRALLRELWPDELVYIEKTHWMRTKDTDKSVKRLVPRYAQRRFYEDVIVRCREEKRPIRSVILKGRQLGFSSFIQCWQYEQCDRENARTSLTISYDDPSTQEMLRKAKFVHGHMWFPRETVRDAEGVLEFKDSGSVFMARTAGNFSAGRGDTYHHIHCSEIPMWADAGETLTSALQCVPTAPGTSVFFESTAKGAMGEFYDAWRAAEGGRSDFIPFFAPWFWDPDYTLGFASKAAEDLFARSLDTTERRIQESHKLSYGQLHWRRYKIRNELQGSEAKFRQEFPCTPSEAFLTTGSPVFNADAVATLEENATRPLWRGNIVMEV